MGQKIVITANMSKNTQRINRKEVVYQWHWPRITAAASAVVLASSALWYATSTPAIAEPTSQVEAVALNTDDKDISVAANEELRSQDQDVNTDSISPEPVASELQENIVTEVKDNSSAELQGPSEDSAEAATHTAQQSPDQDSSVAVLQATLESAAEVSEEAEPVEVKAEFDEQAKVASLAQGTRIDTQKVSRAVLTTQVVDREPISALGNEVSTSDFVSKLMFFTELRGMQGQKVKHVWYFEDQAVADVELGVYTARYRTFSSKNIMPSQVGMWRVELRDENNKLLATSEFRLVGKR
ncbi:DUF2914 domain-containing protein [Pseudoalteromonas sp. SSDWG2]|uniref:DUF2914 domain-containing protein n=1 Tax=Pseudoalteromonas sp. SSDWG2 TaxID=3139391 RepID=UPI003BA9FBD9